MVVRKGSAALRILDEAFVPDERKAEIRERLKRVRGQVEGLDRMLDANRPCLEILTQISQARTMAMMPSNPDAEFLLGWRFQRTGPAVGARFESTAYLGFDYLTDAVRGGVRTSPGLYLGAVTGYASRSFYVWAGALGRRYMSPVGKTADRTGELALYSLVLGYRPGTFRKELPHPDWRVFVEVVGEYSARDRLAGQELPNWGHQVFIAPTLLGLYGTWGISGGPAFPIYSKPNGNQPKDRVRLVVNFTYWF